MKIENFENCWRANLFWPKKVELKIFTLFRSSKAPLLFFSVFSVSFLFPFPAFSTMLFCRLSTLSNSKFQCSGRYKIVQRNYSAPVNQSARASTVKPQGRLQNTFHRHIATSSAVEDSTKNTPPKPLSRDEEYLLKVVDDLPADSSTEDVWFSYI